MELLDASHGVVAKRDVTAAVGGQCHERHPLAVVELADGKVVGDLRLAATRNDVVIGGLLIYTNSSWTLTNWTVSVRQREHSLEDVTKVGPGATNRVDHYSQVFWIGAPAGTVFLVR